MSRHIDRTQTFWGSPWPLMLFIFAMMGVISVILWYSHDPVAHCQRNCARSENPNQPLTECYEWCKAEYGEDKP